MKVKAWDVTSVLQNNDHSVYIVSGSEPFQKEEISQKLRKKMKEKGFVEQLIYHVDSQFDWSCLYTMTQNLSLFSTKKMIELRFPSDYSFRGDAEKALASYTKNQFQDVVLVIICDKMTRSIEKSMWFKKLEAMGVWVAVWDITGYALIQWLQKKLQLAGLKISKEAITFLAERTEGNLLAAAQYIEKLALLFPQGTISLNALGALIDDHAHYDPFKLVEAIIANQEKYSLQIYRSLYWSGMDLSKILWFLVNELQFLQALHQQLQQGATIEQAISILAKKRKRSIFSLQRRKHDYIGFLHRISLKKIESLMEQAAVIDYLIKTGTDKEIFLHMTTFILHMLGIEKKNDLIILADNLCAFLYDTC